MGSLLRVRSSWLAGAFMVAGAITTAGQNLDPAALYRPLSNNWPTYSGDYTGKRYSVLKQINTSNVANLGLSWVARIAPGLSAAGGFGAFGGGNSVPTIVGGYGTAS
jgi:alcohol dehydrogenase (cytochrome c)